MKKVKLADRKDTPHSHGKVKYEYFQQEREYSSIGHSVIFVPPNRWGVEVGKSVITSGSQSTSRVVVADNDLGSESFLNQIAASQTGVAKFQETRLLSSTELKRRALEALKRAEERRKELLRQEADIDSES